MGILNKFKSLFGSSKSKPSDSLKGEIVHFNFKKGYGFIESESLEERLFFHVTELDGKARKGKKVSFSTNTNDKGLHACNIKLLD